MIVKELEQVKRVIKIHIKEYGYGPEEFANMSLLKDTRRVAYLLGVKTSNKRKLELWKDILKSFSAQ